MVIELSCDGDTASTTEIIFFSVLPLRSLCLCGESVPSIMQPYGFTLPYYVNLSMTTEGMRKQ
jgi:hypothetical protein